jgi:replicative DNA helicase
MNLLLITTIILSMKITQKIPNDRDAELGLIGAAIQSKFDDIRSAGINEDFFHDLTCRRMWKMMEELDSTGTVITADTLGHKAKDGGVSIALSDVLEADSACPSPLNWPYWAEVCDEKRKARLVQETGLRLADEAGKHDSIDQLVSEAESIMFSLTDRVSTKTDNRKESFQRIVDTLEEAHLGRRAGVSTGFTGLDKILGGLRGGQLVTIAARPAVGKSALAGNIAEKLVMSGTPVAFFSYEMTQDELNLRMLCSLSDTNLIGDVINEGVEVKEHRLRILSQAANFVPKLNAAPLHIVDNGNLTVSQIRSNARRLVRDEGVRLIIVDYIQLIKAGKDDRQAQRHVQIGNITGELKQMAMELQVPVIGLAQLNRAIEGENRRPRLSDLRESGSIEQDSDVVAFLYVEDPDMWDGPNMLLKLCIGKNRAGRQGEVDLVFVRNKIRFESAYDEQHTEWLNRRKKELSS